MMRLGIGSYEESLNNSNNKSRKETYHERLGSEESQPGQRW